VDFLFVLIELFFVVALQANIDW